MGGLDFEVAVGEIHEAAKHLLAEGSPKVGRVFCFFVFFAFCFLLVSMLWPGRFFPSSPTPFTPPPSPPPPLPPGRGARLLHGVHG